MPFARGSFSAAIGDGSLSPLPYPTGYRLLFAQLAWTLGQISGVEGYVESAASGLMAGRNAAALIEGRPMQVPPRTTALGALAYYVSHADPKHYQPTNITFGIMAPLEAREGNRRIGRAERKLAVSSQALSDLERWNSSEAFSTTSV